MYRRRLTKKQRKLLRTLALTRSALLRFGILLEKGFTAPIEAQRFYSAYLMGGYGFVTELKQQRERARIRRTLLRLRQKRFIEIRRTANRIEYVLTAKGRAATLRELVRAADHSSRKILCAVSFDIPEKERAIREQLVRFLKDCDFVMAQKSLWITDREVIPEIVALLKEMKADKWVHVYEARRAA